MDTQQNTRPVPHGCTVRLVDLAKFTDKPKSKRSKKGSQSPCLSDNIGRWMAASHLEKDLLFFSSCTLSSTQPPVTLISPRHMEATILELCHNKGFPTHRPTIRYPAKWGFQRPAIKIVGGCAMLPLPGIQDFDAQTCFFQFQIHLTRLYLKTRNIIHQKSKSPPKKSRGK